MPESEGRSWADGRGPSFRLAHLHAGHRDPTKGESPWFAFTLGTGDVFACTASSTPGQQINTGYCSYYVARSSHGRGALSPSPVELGVQIGLVGFEGGFVLGLNYAPSYTYSFGSGGEEGSANFNWAGFGLTFDRRSVDATLDSLAKQAQFRCSFFFLRAIGKSPLQASIDLGGIWDCEDVSQPRKRSARPAGLPQFDVHPQPR